MVIVHGVKGGVILILETKVWSLHADEGLSPSQIAKELHMPVNMAHDIIVEQWQKGKTSKNWWSAVKKYKKTRSKKDEGE